MDFLLFFITQKNKKKERKPEASLQFSAGWLEVLAGVRRTSQIHIRWKGYCMTAGKIAATLELIQHTNTTSDDDTQMEDNTRPKAVKYSILATQDIQFNWTE